MASVNMFSTVYLVVAFIALVHAGTSLYPSYPLAVKSPYLSAWMPGEYATSFPTGQPEFWNGGFLRWCTMARVTPSGGSATTYKLAGCPASIPGTTNGAQVGNPLVTATQTIVHVNGGPAQFQLAYMNLISTNYTIHSLPYSYLAVSVNASSTVNVEIFSAIGDNWTGQNGATTATYATQGSTRFIQWYNGNNKVFTQNSNEQAAWGSTAFGTQPRAGSTVSAAFGTDTAVFSNFTSNGNLAGVNPASQQSTTASIGAFAHSLNNVGATQQKVVFAVGNDRSQAINYNGQTQTGYYRAAFATVPPALDFFLSYYETGLSAMTTLDTQVTSWGNTISTNYADILDANVRQTYGAFELTIPLSTMSTAVTNIFEKEISSDGNVNSIDSIFPELPLLYLLTPNMITDLLNPIMEYVSGGSAAWNENYILHDIGGSYPVAPGYKTETCPNGPPACSPEYMPLEVTAQLIILIAAQGQAVGNNNYANKYKSLLLTYADYLAANGLHPPAQLSTVDALGAPANQVQLAVISAIGLGAMGQMFSLSNYTSTAKNFATQLLTNTTLGAMTTGTNPHFAFTYNQPATWSVVFPLMADKLLGLNLFSAAYTKQSAWYATQFASSGYGLPYAGGLGINWGITDWNFWAASVSSSAVQSQVIDTTHKFMTDGQNTEPWGTKYNVTDPGAGAWLQNRARSTVGANFAIYLINKGT